MRIEKRLSHLKPTFKVAWTLLVSLLVSIKASALGLGEIEVYSSLNQSLQAEISLNNVRPGEMDDLILQLASDDAFSRAGVERVFLPMKLKFKPVTKGNGDNVIVVTTEGIVREPFLNFLVNVEWPRGNLIREYTILLDPPSFSRSSSSVSAPVSAPVSPLQEALLGTEDSGTGSITPITRDTVEPLPEPVPQPLVEPVPEIIPEPLQDQSSALPPLPGLEIEQPAIVEEQPLPVVDAQPSDLALSLSDRGDLPDIELSFDDALEYDEGRTNVLLQQFEEEDVETTFAQQPQFQQPEQFERSPVVSPAITETIEGELGVTKGDTLWDIANRTKASDVSINQAMISILRANPDAFIDSNINNLKTGVVLRIPERENMLAVSSRDAIAQAREQNALWKEYRQRLSGATISEPVDTSLINDTSENDINDSVVETSEVEPVSETIVDEANNVDSNAEQELSILAPSDDDAVSDRVAGAQDGELDGTIDENNMMLAKEAIAAVQLEKSELQNRIDIRADELEQTEALLQAKNEQMALIQSRLQGLNESSEELVDTAVEKIESIDQELAQQDNSITLETGTVIEADNSELALQEQQDSVSEEVVEETVELIQPEQTIELPSQQETKYAFLYKYLPPPLNGMMEGLVKSYGLLAALVFILPILLIAFLANKFSGRRDEALPIAVDSADVEPKIDDFESTVIINQEVVEDKPSLLDKIKGLFKKDKKEELVAESTVPEVEPAHNGEDDITGEYEGDLPETTGAFDPVVDEAAATLEQGAVEEDDSDKTSQFLAVDVDSDEMAAVEPESDDTTAEADVYLAYGLFDQAEDLLKDALASNADKPEYNAKLLETYFAGGKKDEFESLATNFKETHAKDHAVLWTKVVAMGQELLPGNNLFAGESSGLKAADFVPSKPVSTDIDVGDAASDGPDFDIGEATDVVADIDVSQPMMAASETLDSFEETIISPSAEALSSEEIETDATAVLDSAEDLLGDDDIAESLGDDMDIDFSADELNLDDGALDLGDDDDLDIDVSLDEDDLNETLSGMEETLIGDLESTPVDDTDLDLDETDFDLDEDIEIDLDPGSESATLGGTLDADQGIEIDTGVDDDIDLEDALDLSTELDDDNMDTVMDMGLDDSAGEETIGEETIISDDLTDIDFGDSEDIFATSTHDAVSIDLGSDTDIADIAVDDEVETKLDLARAYLDMGDKEGAKSSLEEVIQEGSDTQKQEAESLMQKIA